MSSLNSVTISGNLTREPEFKQTASGMPVMNIGVAVHDRRKNQATGEWEEYANFVDCTMFGKRAEALSRWDIHKGTKVAITGRLHYSTWERDGQKRSKLEVYIDEIDIMSQRGGQQNQYASPKYAAPAPQYAAPQYTAPTPQYAAPVAAVPQAPTAPPAYQPQAIPAEPLPTAPEVYDEDIPF